MPVPGDSPGRAVASPPPHHLAPLLAWAVLALAAPTGAIAQAAGGYDGPIIDVHLHAIPFTAQGPPPLGQCPHHPELPHGADGRTWPQAFGAWAKQPPCDDPVWSPESDSALMHQTLAALERHDVIGVTSGPLDYVRRWEEAVPERIVRGLILNVASDPIPVDSLRALIEAGEVEVLGEVTNQYAGVEPSDPRFAPYLALAEELDVPVGIHVGTGPPGAAHLFPDYRARLHSPLLLEEVLVAHPDLRLYVMHAGWPMLDDMLAVLWAHPHVYVGLGVISWVLPRPEFHRYLRRLVEAGFGKRIMYGSDQMVWPGVIDPSIAAIREAPFLTRAQKRDILYGNAARFFRLGEEGGER